MRRWLLLVVLAVACACTGESPMPSGEPPTSLAGAERVALPTAGEFVSTAVTEGGEPRRLRTGGVRIHVYFGGPNVAFYAGCNRMGGRAEVDGGEFRITRFMGTQIGCTREDDWLREFFRRGVRWQRSGHELSLTSGDAVIRLVDRRFATPDQPLAGEWAFGSVRGPGERSRVVPPPRVLAQIHTRFSLRFDGSGRFDGHDGCAPFDGRYSVHGLRVTFSDLRPATASCRGPRRAVQLPVRRVLQGSAEYWIEGKHLELTTRSGWGLDLSRAISEERRLEANWQVTALIVDGSAAPVSSGVEAYIHIRPSGRVYGSTGCNRFRGTFAANDGRVTFAGVTQTRKRCSGAQAEVERAVQQVLRGTAKFRVGWHALTLTTEPGDGLRLHWA